MTPTACATVSTMTSVGVRALRQRASELLRRVEAGETIEITDRGRPVALLSPLPQGGPYEQLLASGEIERATLDVVDLPEPLDLDAGVELPSVTLARLRDGGHLSRLVRDRQARGSRARVGRAAPLPSHPPPASVECPCARGGHAGPA